MPTLTREDSETMQTLRESTWVQVKISGEKKILILFFSKLRLKSRKIESDWVNSSKTMTC